MMSLDHHILKLIVNPKSHLKVLPPFLLRRLLSLAKSSLTESSSKFVAGTHPDTNPEQAPGLFSALLTGEKALPDRWAVSVCVCVLCVCSHNSALLFYKATDVRFLPKINNRPKLAEAALGTRLDMKL